MDKYGVKRPDSSVSGSVKYSKKDVSGDYDDILSAYYHNGNSDSGISEADLPFTELRTKLSEAAAKLKAAKASNYTDEASLTSAMDAFEAVARDIQRNSYQYMYGSEDLDRYARAKSVLRNTPTLLASLRKKYKDSIYNYYNTKRVEALRDDEDYQTRYNYYKYREQRLRPMIDDIAADKDRRDNVALEWVRQYRTTGAGEQPEYAKELSERFENQDRVIDEYRHVNEMLKSMENTGVHYSSDGEVDTESGITEAQSAYERNKRLDGAGLKIDEIPDQMSDINAYRALRQPGSDADVEKSKIKAYEQYEKNKNKKYNDWLFGWIAGNFKLGSINEASGDANYAVYKAGSNDTEASDVYMLLSERIYTNNEKTFASGGAFKNTVSTIAQYAPQGINQLGHKLIGGIIGAGVAALATGGTGTKKGFELGGSAAVAMYAYKQTAGATYVNLLRGTDLSAADAKLLAGSEALASSVIEFGLEYAASKLWFGSGVGSKVTSGVNAKKIIGMLMDAGISQRGAQVVVGTAVNAGKVSLNTLSEGMEEFIQEGISITTQRYAKEGRIADPMTLLCKSIAFGEYSEEDKLQMREAFKGGAIVGGFMGGGQMMASVGANTAFETVDTIQTGREHKALGKENVDAIIDRGQHANVNQSARRYADKIADKDSPSAWNVGKQYKYNLRADAEDNAIGSDLRKRLQTTQAYDLTGDNGEVDIGKRHIRLNPDGDMPEIDTIKHEDTHILERYAPDEHKKYMQFIAEAAAKNDAAALEARKEQLRKNGYSEDEIDYELAAELPELFLSHGKTIENLIKRKPGFASKVYDIINGALKGDATATTGGVSLSRADLYKAQHLWAKAIEKAQANIEAGAEANGDIKYAVKMDKYGNKYWNVDTEKDIFKDLKTLKELKKAAYNYLLNGASGEVVTGTIDGQDIVFNRISAEEYVYGAQSQELSKKGGAKAYAKKMRIAPSIEDLIENSTVQWHAPDEKDHKQFPNGFDNYRGRVGIDNTIFEYVVRVGNTVDNNVFYDVNLDFAYTQKDGAELGGLGHKSTPRVKKASAPSFDNSISHSNKNVKHLYTNKGDEGARVRAERMEADGASPEEIWKGTGWARDLSGQWVTEIDDSTAVYSGQGDTLGESLNHPELYGSHPELGGYGYGRVDMPSGNANFDASNKQINVNANNSPEQQRGSTFHETQHALQRAEGRPGGSSVEYWARWLHEQKYFTKYRIDDLNDMLSGREPFDEELDEHPIVQEYKANATQPSLGYERGLNDARKNAAEASLKEHQQKLAELEQMSAAELYRNTAGEIEARDAASRIDMTIEERRQNFPEAFKQENRDKAVFADGGVSYFAASSSESTSLKKQIRENLDLLNNMSPIKKYTYDIENRYNALPKEQRKESMWNDFLDEHKEKVIDGNVEIYREGIGPISIRKSEILGGLRYLFTDGERAAVFAIPDIITYGIEIEFHDNHKVRGYPSWTFAAPVEINGVSGNMAVTVRNTDRHKYKMHRVLMPDGTMFDFSGNEKSNSYQDRTVDSSVDGSLSFATASTDTISHSNKNVKKSRKNVSEQTETPEFKEWFGDSKVVNEDGTPKVVYHGTESFGFTQFDLTKYDDNSTIFLADTPELASTYSGLTGEKRLADVYGKNVDEMSLDELAEEMTALEEKFYMPDTGREKSDYTVYNSKKLNELISIVDDGMEELSIFTDKVVTELSNRMAADYNDKDYKEHRMAVALKEALDDWDYYNISTPLYRLIHSDSYFRNTLDDGGSKYAELEKNIRLMNKLRDESDLREGVIVKESLGGYSQSILYKNELVKEIKALMQKGNYALYAKMENPLIIDAHGEYWNKLDYETPDGNILNKTRAVADFAKNYGFDGVIFKNIRDNGGRSYNVNLDDMVSNVYVVFSPEQVKSATDNIGTFDKNNPDIRYSRKDVTGDTTTENGENVSQLFTNTMHKGHYSPEFTMEADSRANDFTYNPISNKETYEGAQAHIDAVGEEKALRELYSRESWSADDTAVSLALIERFNQNKDYSSAVDVFENMRKHATKAGQAIQAISIVNRLTPEGQYMAMQRMADKRKNATIEKIERGLDNKGKAQFRKELAEARAKDRAEAEAKRQQRRTQNAEELLNRIRLAAGVTTDEKTGETRRGFKKKTEATKAKMSRDEAGKQLLELLRNARTGKQQTKNNSDIKKSRKNAENTFSKDDITLLEMWLKNGDVYNALYYVQDMDLSNLTPEDDSFVDNYMARLEEALSQPAADIFSEDDRNRLYETLRSGDINKVQEILDGFELDLTTESDEQFLAEFADEFAARLKRKDEGVSKAQKPVKPLGKTIYSPTTAELTAKPDAFFTDIEESVHTDSDGHIPDVKQTFNNIFTKVKKMPWFKQSAVNGDKVFAEKYGKLETTFSRGTLEKGRSYKTPFMSRQFEIMPYLNKIFENGVVVKVTKDSGKNGDVKAVYTLLSPVRFYDGKIGVVKLNVREYSNPVNPNNLHENKILDIVDAKVFEGNKKNPDMLKPLPPAMDGSSTSEPGSTMSISEMLEFVKGEDIKYLPDDYFSSESVFDDGRDTSAFAQGQQTEIDNSFVPNAGSEKKTKPSLGYEQGLKEARIKAAQALIDEQQAKLLELEQMSAAELYRNTAGEIEARDAASRIDMTAEERRNTFPEAFKQRDGVVFAVDNGNNMQYNTDKWHTNLSSAEMKNLNQIIKHDIKHSKNKVTDGANWLFTRVGNKSVFAIYSTDVFKNPTLLYASDKVKGIKERDLLLNVLERIKNGKSFNGQSRFTDRLLNGDWLQQGNNSRNSFRALGRNGNVGNASVLQGKPPAYGSAALRNVLRNLFEIQSARERDGVRENGGVKNDHSSFVHRKSGSNTHPLGFRRFGRWADDAQIDGEYYRLIERSENIDPEADIMEQVDSLFDISSMVKHRAELLGYEVKNGKAYKDGSVVKLASSMTYDDGGNVIPLSQRFDKNNPDKRYSRKDVSGDTATEDGENVSQLFTNTMHKGQCMVLNNKKSKSFDLLLYVRKDSNLRPTGS